MNSHKYILTVLFLAAFLGLIACSNYAGDKALTNNIISDSSSTVSQQTNEPATDSRTRQNDELTKIYTLAIAEFIKAAYHKDKTTFDTLYFGKHVYGQPDDFPDIALPATIEKTQIKLVTPEAGQKKLQERKSLIYVNMMGWVDTENAAFVLVVFSNGGEHQYDYFIDFTHNTSTNKFELDKIGIENYLQSKGHKPVRQAVYDNGRYVEDK